MKERSPRIFLEPQKISKHLHCVICHEVFDNPNRLSCGHTFCYVCIEQWAAMRKFCPLCKTSVRNRPPEKDLIAASLIDDLITKCSHSNCDWTGVYSVLKKHQRNCIHRSRRNFQQRNFDQVVELHDESECHEVIEELDGINGRKKFKAQEKQDQPTFAPTPPQQQPSGQLRNSNLQPHQKNLENCQLNPRNSSISNQHQSNSDSDFEVPLHSLIPNRQQKRDQDMRQKEEVNLKEFGFKRFMENERNLMMSKKNRKEQTIVARNSWKKQQISNTRNTKGPIFENSDSQSLQNMSNPFLQPIVERKNPNTIVIDSSNESIESLINCSRQSGQMSLLQIYQGNRSEPQSPKNFNNGREENEKQGVRSQNLHKRPQDQEKHHKECIEKQAKQLLTLDSIKNKKERDIRREQLIFKGKRN